MHRIATLLLTLVLFWCVGILTVRGDRPGSYANVDNPSQHRPAQSHAAGPPRFGAGNAYRHSSIYFSVGAPVPYVVAPSFYHGARYPYTGIPSGSYGSYWGYGIHYNPSLNITQYNLPPVQLPGELLYGPQAVQRFFGIPRPPPMIPAPAVPNTVPTELNAAAVADRLRKSNATAQMRARRFLVIGDARFLQQQFHQAVQRYKSAIAIAPDLPETYYRQGFALLAVKQYRLAAKALRIAVELDPAMLRTHNLIRTLYGDNHLVKESHLERLADSALANPDNGDLYFLVGAFLYADGEGERGVKFLRKAADIAKPASTFLAPLLDPLPPADVDEAVAELDT